VLLDKNTGFVKAAWNIQYRNRKLKPFRTYQSMQAISSSSNDIRPRLPRREVSTGKLTTEKISRRRGLKKQKKNQRRIKPKGVCFDSVEIRFYERVCGDHPSCSSGPPMSLGWEVLECISQTVEQFENARGAMSRGGDFRLTARERRNMLIDWRASYTDIVAAVPETNHIKHQRRTTVNNLRNYDRWEEAVDIVGRSLKQRLRLGSRSSSCKYVGKGEEDGEEDATVCLWASTRPLDSLNCNIDLEVRTRSLSARISDRHLAICTKPAMAA
jgi:hypothetical protein